MLGSPDLQAHGWIELFQTQIGNRDYEAARETLRRAIAFGVGGVADQYAQVLEDFLRSSDETVPLLRLGECAVKQMDGMAHGLFVSSFCSWGTELWNERPLAYIQSPAS
eukprot:CAMPEP_0194543222 /NCGR_PEP_ID=MMETSP0253-20130528/85431_1 /TAXON_ID=2966 /ORGANISM="Noctiluca scintillans" /LENGTH=108 /DNA_ID=CAMNT_0039389959 /DNA_START=9 /DNA_END=332 /DNA_ORIENTATION=-